MFSGTPSSLQLLLPAQPQQHSHTPVPPSRLRNGPFGIKAAHEDQTRCAAAALLSGRALLSRKLLLSTAAIGAGEALRCQPGAPETMTSFHTDLGHVAGGRLAGRPKPLFPP